MDITTKALDIQAAEPVLPKGIRSENAQINPRQDLSLTLAPEWTFSQLFGKKRLLTSINITPSTIGEIFSYDNTPETFTATFSNIQMNNFFSFVRYNIHFEMEIQSHFQHQGALIINTLPWIANSGLYQMLGLNPSITNTIANRVMLPHDFITFGHNGNYNVVLPWTHNRNMLPINNQSAVNPTNALRSSKINSLSISIFDPLQAVASAVSTTTLRIWVHAEDVQYSGFRPTY
nr:MAG: putative capsid protein [Picornavirales sp.]